MSTVNKIVCAANRVVTEKGAMVVIPCVRHMDGIYHALAKELNVDRTNRPEQGFLDRYGVWHDRKSAWVIAEQAGQLRDISKSTEGVLFSEHLY